MTMQAEPVLRDSFVTTNGVRLHYVEAGQGPLVLLLHGFPECWYSWRHQIPALARAGYRAVAVDLRGYNLSDKPAGVDAYTADKLAADVAGLIPSLGAERAHVVGHDWGGGIAWFFAMLYPERLKRLAILNVPHPLQFMKALRSSPAQMAKSWYIFFFQLPWLPEWMFRARNYRALRQTFRHDPLRKGAFTEADIDQMVQAFAQPGAATATINWYRAMFRRGPSFLKGKVRPIEAPVLIIWGEHDRYIRNFLAEPDPKLVPHCRVERLADASHWVQVDRPEKVNQLLIDFLGPA